MSDTLADFLAKTDAMFNEAERILVNASMNYVVRMAWPLIDTTPGPNLQFPDTTEYIATGRLRGAWRVSLEALGDANRWDGGPYTEHGDDTLAGIEAAVDIFRAVRLVDLPRAIFLVNDVAYGYIVHWGLGRHTTARPWVENVANDVPADAARGAMAMAMRA